MERSRQEVERTLVRYGASGFAYSWERRPEILKFKGGKHLHWCDGRVQDGGKDCECRALQRGEREVVIVGFKMKTESGERQVQLEVPMPHETEAGTKARAEAATRQRWRALVLVLKAKLEAVASGISTLEAEFLANVVMANGMTIGQAILPRMSEAVESGRLLPAAGETR